MIAKPFEKSQMMKGLDALKKRLPVHHEKYTKIEDETPNKHSRPLSIM